MTLACSAGADAAPPLAGPLAARRRLGRADAGHPGRLRADRRPARDRPPPRRLPARAARAPRASSRWRTRAPRRRSDGTASCSPGPILAQVALADDAEIRDRLRQRPGDRPDPERPRPRAARAPGSRPTTTTTSPRFADRERRRSAPAPTSSTPAATTTLDATIGRLWLFLALGVDRRHGARRARRRRRRRPRDAPDRGADRRRPRDRHRPATPRGGSPSPRRDDEVGRARPHARRDAPRARRLPLGDRADGPGPARVHRRRLARAAHAADEHPRQPRAAPGAASPRAARTASEGEIVASALGSSQRMRRLVADLLLLARADAGRTGTRRECDLAEIAARRWPRSGPSPTGTGSSSTRRRRLGRRQPRRAPPDGRQPARQRRPPHAGRLDRRRSRSPAATASAVLEVDRRRPRGAGRAARADLLALRPRHGPADLAADSGTGLGLAIVEAVADVHGGRSRPASSHGGGAVHGPAAAAELRRAAGRPIDERR